MENASSIQKKRKRENTINSYFFPQQSKKVYVSRTEGEPSPFPNDTLKLSKGDEEQRINNPQQSKEVSVSSGSRHSIQYDIGNYIDKEVTPMIKKSLIMNPWTPPKNYPFPFSTHKVNGKEIKRYASFRYLVSFAWLVFSHIQQGYFCKYCSLFVNCKMGGYQKNIPLKQLVSQPLRSFKNLLGISGDLTAHSNNKYHLDAVNSAKDFLERLSQPYLRIENRINNLRLKTVKENRERLEPIVKTIILFGRQNIPFRGHRDDGKLMQTEENLAINSNFRAVLQYRAECDSMLKSHLENTSSRATYISKTTQNELINCCKEEIISKIICDVQAAQFYSILFDETTDISKKSQLALVIRYVINNIVNERFLDFIDVRDELNLFDDPANREKMTEEQLKLTGKKIGQVVLSKIRNLALDIKKCVGITTDGCSTMTSEICGAVATVLRDAKNAAFTPCLNHSLNLSISKTNKIIVIKNVVHTIQEVTFFINASSKRSALLREKFGRKLVNLCETRWIERHDAVLQFRYSLPDIINILKYISNWKDRDASVKSSWLLKSLMNSDILTGIICLSDILACTKGLSQLFQKININLKIARDELELTLRILKRRRQKSEEYFKNIFTEICGVAKELQIEIKVPRLANKQIYRENYLATDPETYYRLSLYIPALDNIIQDIESRFSNDTVELYNFSLLFPIKESFRDLEAVHKLVNKYSDFLDNCPKIVKKELEIELEKWDIEWANKIDNFSCITTYLLNNCNPLVYPYINFFLRIFNTLSISNASPERSFSSLKRLKSWLRSTMSQERLTGLALLHIHKDIDIDPFTIIDRYSDKKKRRIEFSV